MLSARFFTTFIVSLAAAAICQAADLPPQGDVPGSSIVKDIPEQTREDFYAKRRDIRRQAAPRVLFVPGILGSKIMECRTDGSQCRDVWGTVGSFVQRDIDLRVKPDRRYRTDVVETVLFNDVSNWAISARVSCCPVTTVTSPVSKEVTIC